MVTGPFVARYLEPLFARGVLDRHRLVLEDEATFAQRAYHAEELYLQFNTHFNHLGPGTKVLSIIFRNRNFSVLGRTHILGIFFRFFETFAPRRRIWCDVRMCPPVRSYPWQRKR